MKYFKIALIALCFLFTWNVNAQCCGDGVCDPGEDALSCPSDCGGVTAPSFNCAPTIGAFNTSPTWPINYSTANANGWCYTVTGPFPKTVCFEYIVPPAGVDVKVSISVKGCNTGTLNQGNIGGGCNTSNSTGTDVSALQTFDNNCNFVTNGVQAGGALCFTPGEKMTVCYTLTGACGPVQICPVINCGSSPCPTSSTSTICPPFNFTTSTSSLCVNGIPSGTAIAVPDCGSHFSYAWNDPAAQTTASATNLSAGNYQVVVTNTAYNCDTTLSLAVVDPPVVATPLVSTVSPTCLAAGTNTITNYDIAVSYAFTPAGPSITSAGAITGMIVGTSYTVVATLNGCNSAVSSAFSNALQLPPPVTPLINSNAATCSSAGVSTITNYDGTHTYIFTPAGPVVGPSGLISGMTVGTSYTVISSFNGCMSNASSAFINTAQLPSTATPIISTNAASCTSAGTSTIINYNAMHVYVFTPAGPSIGVGGLINGMTNGISYTVTAEINACTSPASNLFVSTTLSVPHPPTVSTSAATCIAAGISNITNYDANNSYVFSPTGPIVNALGEILGASIGVNYGVSATNPSSCVSSTVSFTNAAQLTAPTITVVATNPLTCGGNGTLTFNFTNVPDGTYTITHDSGTFNVGVVNGSATVTASAGNYGNLTISYGNCTALPESSTIVNPAPPNEPILNSTPATCFSNGVVTIANYDAGNTYSFSPTGPTTNANGIITNALANINYSVIATNNGGCVSLPVNFMLEPQHPLPIISAGNDVSICAGSPTTLTATGGVTYQWDNGLGAGSSHVVSPIANTTYTVTGSAANGCTNTDEVTVNVSSSLSATITGAAEVCKNEKQPIITLTGTNGTAPYTFTYNINGGTNQVIVSNGNTATLNVSTDVAGDFTYTLLSVQDGNNTTCSNSQIGTVLIKVFPNPTAAFTPSTYEVIPGNNVVFFANNSQNATSYKWLFGDGIGHSDATNPTYTFDTTSAASHFVTLIATNTYNCTDTARVIIRMIEDVIFYIPNSFTPDGNEFNNIFKPVLTSGIDIFNYKMEIFDRWGELIFETSHVSYGWDGTYQYGDRLICQDGSYTWKISFFIKEVDQPHVRYGHVTLLR